MRDEHHAIAKQHAADGTGPPLGGNAGAERRQQAAGSAANCKCGTGRALPRTARRGRPAFAAHI